MRLTTHTYVGKENTVRRMLQRAAFFILHSSFFILLMASCSSDDAADHTEGTSPEDNNGKLTLRIATQSETRARSVDWQDGNGLDEEMMNLWVVVLTNNSNVVQKVFACKPTNTDGQREIDEVCQISKGDYRAYSFANMSVAKVAELLGITITMPTMSADDTVYEATAVSGTVNADKAVTVNGNSFNKFTSTDDNGFGSYGIPMSNVQTIAATDTEKDLIVVRMLAKMEIRLFNETGAAVTVQSITLSDVTSNVANNLKLLPTLTYRDDMEAHHKDIQPNLNDTPATVDYTYSIPTAQQSVAVAPSTGDPAQTLTFYVNESATPANADHLFYLTLKMSDTEYRYALISNQDSEWDYIARNDYRIIPIVIDDYKFELIPYDFPPIGVYPVSVREIDTENHVFDFTFHDYGHFHLLPKVTKVSDSSSVPFGSTEGTGTRWTLNTDWAGTWYTAATKGGTWLTAEQITDNGFYRDQTATADGDEVGGAPVWYLNDGTAGPQWDPAGGTNYAPFIFGYIAEPATLPMTEDKQIYHEMKIKLYVDGTYRRDMLYRFYMTLSKDQMLGAPRHAAARRPHSR